MSWFLVLLGVHLERFPPKKYMLNKAIKDQESNSSLKQYIWQHFRGRDHPEELSSRF